MQTRGARHAAGAVVVATVWEEATTVVAVPEAAAAKFRGTVTDWPGIVVAVNSCKLLFACVSPKGVLTGVQVYLGSQFNLACKRRHSRSSVLAQYSWSSLT